MCNVERYVNMVVGCGIGCDHSQMWWNDAVMQDAVQLCCVIKTWCDAEMVVQCIMWPVYHSVI